ncbi:uncharacterized protein EV422DRAFT_595559 [Fimicolochytrium jonesii]|uniref:uncharacterized protein n=1 Tax=Fimicolochytrium jonesii TaxID=1396493 RepID=UPI0022FE1217|nr:uncharacterized protein EV422DRAFT_595559 [Fimicolochytrium jonesii]KAI8821152.1 hypothetical protein EV422DRAFT_595559 [Fimicolochytrium jonesii]
MSSATNASYNKPTPIHRFAVASDNDDVGGEERPFQSSLPVIKDAAALSVFTHNKDYESPYQAEAFFLAEAEAFVVTVQDTDDRRPGPPYCKIMRTSHQCLSPYLKFNEARKVPALMIINTMYSSVSGVLAFMEDPGRAFVGHDSCSDPIASMKVLKTNRVWHDLYYKAQHATTGTRTEQSSRGGAWKPMVQLKMIEDVDDRHEEFKCWLWNVWVLLTSTTL